MWRVTVRWSGGQIGSGFTNMFFTEGISTAQVAADAVRTFFRSCYNTTGAFLPLGVTIAFPTGVDVLDPVTGVLITTIPVTNAGNTVGADSGKYSAPSGACVSWRTAGVVNGRVVKGRTFLVPIGLSAMDTDGTPLNSWLTTVSTAAAALIADPAEFVIWHRPASLALGGGSVHPVLAQAVRDRSAVLTSRR
jgi:hypothetical protein